jgi:hypothetical protein
MPTGRIASNRTRSGSVRNSSWRIRTHIGRPGRVRATRRIVCAAELPDLRATASWRHRGHCHTGGSACVLPGELVACRDAVHRRGASSPLTRRQVTGARWAATGPAWSITRPGSGRRRPGPAGYDRRCVRRVRASRRGGADLGMLSGPPLDQPVHCRVLARTFRLEPPAGIALRNPIGRGSLPAGRPGEMLSAARAL